MINTVQVYQAKPSGIAKLGFLLAFICLHLSCFAQQNVLFGERNLKEYGNDLFFDKEGTLYPDFFIADSALQQSKASLSTWYAEHATAFTKIAKQYNCTCTTYSPSNLILLNQEIKKAKLQMLNKRVVANNSLTFLVHGFRKPFVKNQRDYTADDDYLSLEKTLDEQSATKHSYVRVYWDALHLPLAIKNLKPIMRLFEKSQENADSVGLALRYFIAKSEAKNIQVLSHSLGTKLACISLFPINANDTFSVADKKIHLVLIAPAIEGIPNFKFYGKRNSLPKSIDNYTLTIVYNENDFVLRKKDNILGVFGPGTKRYGNTSLGCNYKNSCSQLADYFKTNFPNTQLQFIDASETGKCHYVQCYCSNTAFRSFLKGI